MSAQANQPPLYLVDKSAYTRRNVPQVEATLAGLMARDQVATCEITALELLYSARNLPDYERIMQDLRALRWLHTSTTTLATALDVQHQLARRGQHRLPIPDLMIAATAAEHGAVLLHYDHDFERISQVTGQTHRWIAPPGTID